MSNPQLLSIGNIEITNFSGDFYVTLKFWQQHEGTRYYRLRCFHRSGDYAPSDFPVTYIYLGAYKTSHVYQYTVPFKIQSTSPSFQSLFERYNSTAVLIPSVELQSSASSNFSSYETSEESRIVNIKIKGAFFAPIWSKPTWEDEMYSVNAGVRALTGSSSKGVRGFSEICFNVPQATGRYNTTITKYNVNISGAFSESYTPQEMAARAWKIYLRLSKFPKLYGKVNVIFSVEDSRGFETVLSYYIEIVNYQKPYLSVNNTHRQGGTGSTVILDFRGEWQGVPLTLTCDSITAYEQGSDTPIATIVPSLTISNTSFLYNSAWSGVAFESKKSYNIHVTISDSVQTVSIVFPVTVGIPVVAIRRERVGINNPDPQAELDVTGEIFQNGFPIFAYRGELGTDGEAVDLNKVTATGLYAYKADSSDVSHFPDSNSPFVLLVLNAGGYIIQKVWYMGIDWEFTRNSQISGWTAWKKVTVT